MSIHCKAGVEGKVTVYLPEGLTQNILSKNCPIEVITEDVGARLVAYSGQIGTPCYKHPSWFNPAAPAVWIWDAYYASPQPSTNETATFTSSFQGSRGQVYILAVAVDNIAEISFNGKYIGSVSEFSSLTTFNLIGVQGTNKLTFNCINVPVGNTDPRGNPGGLYFTVSSRGCSFQIKDQQRILYSKIFDSCPRYEVSCSQECPDGYLKCLKAEYPGYCCIPCKQIVARINNLTNRINRYE